jgi:dTDP-4-amino-4,6-dideoxygalactose transaminase
VGLGDEVIVPAYTFIATASACLMAGAVPIFVDIEPDTYNIDATRMEEAITAQTKAIIPVHIGGCPADLDSILEIARSHGITVIEDACQAHAASWKGVRVGSIADMGCFSFQSSKNINAGEGGIILTRSEALADRVWSIRNCGRVREGRWYQHEIVGFNFRMTEWQGAVLLAQLTRMEDLANRREANAGRLSERIAEIEGIEPQKRDARVTEHAYHLFIFRYDPAAFGGLPREAFLTALRAEGIPCSKGYDPLYRAQAIQRGVNDLRRYVTGRETGHELPDCPVTEKACDVEGVWLAQNLLLGTEDDMDDIVRAVDKIKANADGIARGD